jgi:glycosyltransferase involved in cell wall biosynthesis
MILPVPTIGVTVAIATLDRPDGLAACLAAVLAGTAAPAEVLVIDQGHPAKTAMAIAATATDVPVRHVVARDRGLSRSRNLAAATATSPVLAMTDDDCIPDPGWVAAIAARLCSDPSTAAVTGPIRPGPIRGDRSMAVSSRLAMESALHDDPARPWLAGSGGNFAVRVADLRAVGGFDIRLGAGSPGCAGEDLDVFARLVATGRRIAYVPRASVLHERQRANRRWRTRWTYGTGAGAVAGVALAERRGYARRLLRGWLAMRVRRAGGALKHADLRTVGEELVVLAGTVRGLVYGLRAPR